MNPKFLESNGLHNPFTGKKKWRITCGKCQHCWDEKVPINDTCSAICPNCKEQNKWSLLVFEKEYEQMINGAKNELRLSKKNHSKNKPQVENN